jgi:hypothetical protein
MSYLKIGDPRPRLAHRVADIAVRGLILPARKARVTRCSKGHPYDRANTYRRSDGGHAGPVYVTGCAGRGGGAMRASDITPRRVEMALAPICLAGEVDLGRGADGQGESLLTAWLAAAAPHSYSLLALRSDGATRAASTRTARTVEASRPSNVVTASRTS